MQDIWLTIGDVTLVGSAIITTAVVAAYAFSRFEATQVGRQFMLTKFLFACILDLGAISVIFGTQWDARLIIRATIYGLVGFVMLRWLIIIIKSQRDGRRKRHPVWDAPEAPPPVRRES